jgi:hypothetical protein
MDTSILQLTDTHNDSQHVLAKHMIAFREVKYKDEYTKILN